MRAAHRSSLRWHACLAATVTLAPLAVRADEWLLDSSVSTRLETNDNTTLTPVPSGTVNTLSLSSSLFAARQTEREATRINADVAALRQHGAAADDRIDGRLALQQTYKGERHSLRLDLNLAQDFNSDLIDADVTQARGRRHTTGLSTGWSYALTERLSAGVQGALTRAGYDSELTQASDFRNSTISGSLSYLLSEVASLTSQLAHGNYRTVSGSNRSATDSADIGVSRAFSERASGSLNLGVYRTRSTTQGFVLVCPLPVSFCEAGLVAYEVVSQSFEARRTGLQFSTSARYAFDEVTGLSFSASRQQVPSGAGVLVRSDALSFDANRSLSPRLSAALNYGVSRSTLQDGRASSRCR
jgi:hypothetical protein